MSDRVLRAYYDLAVSPPSFDICVFLYLAEMERLHRGLDAFDLIVVANRDTGFRYDLIYKPMNEIIWRLNHVVLPAHKLVPACRRAVYYPNREEALREFDQTKPIFPPGYTIGLPINKFLDSDVLTSLYAGKPLASLRATAGAAEKVKEWLDHHVGDRKAITITLRGEGFQPGRNSNLGEWVRFARALDPSVYCPVFVRDTADVFKPPNAALQDFLAFDPAALDIDLRLALCELAHINLFVDSGPAVLCMLDDRTRCIRFKLFLENNPHAGAISFYRRGYSVGMQWAATNTHQISVWEDDTAECIMREFTALESKLDAGAKPEQRPLPPVALVATNMIAGQNYYDAITVTSKAAAKNPNDLEARYLLAIAFMRGDERLAALKEFQELINIPEMRNIVLIPFAACLWATGRINQATDLLVDAAQQEPENFLSRKSIAQTLLEMGEESEGLKILSQLIKEAPRDESLLIEYAKYLQDDLLTIPDALETIEFALLQKPNSSALHNMMAENLSRLAEYEKAIYHAEKAITLKNESTLKDWVRIAQWSKYQRNIPKMEFSLQKAEGAVKLQLDDNVSPINNSIEWLAAMAQIELLRGHVSNAHSCYAEIISRYGQEDFRFPSDLYRPETLDRLADFHDLINRRDVFIFSDGPSITMLDGHWASFASANACLIAANWFRSFEQTFLLQTQATIDVALITDSRLFRNAFTEIENFLSRGCRNLLITQRSVTERLGARFPSRQKLERQFDEKILYFGGLSEISPATPYNPLRLLSGNPLSNAIVLAAIGGARRIFLFGADGPIVLGRKETDHLGFDRFSFRKDATEADLPILQKILMADTFGLGHIVEMGLIAAQHLFGIVPPPIYNVSPDSKIDAFHRLTYEDALELLESNQATDNAAAVSG